MTTQPTLPNSSAQKLPNNSAIMITNNTLSQPGFILANNGQNIATTISNTNQTQPFIFTPGSQINAVNNANIGKRPQFVSFGLDGNGLIAYSPGNVIGSQQQLIRTSNFNQMIPANLAQTNIQTNTPNIPPGSTIFMSPIIGQTNVSNQIISNNRVNQQFAFAAPALATVSMLPNGQLCVTPNQQSQPVSLNQSQIQPTLQPTSQTKNIKPINSKPLAPLNSQSNQGKNEPSPTEVLKQLNAQIENLASLPVLTEAQSKRLNELKVVHEKLVKATANKKIYLAKEKPKGIYNPSDNDESSNDSSLQKNSVINPMTLNSKTTIAPAKQIIPNPLRHEIYSKLQANNLLPKCALGTILADTFIVEFRMANNRYQLRMTRQQKESMEKLLFGQPPKKQSEYLSVFQQEQAKIPQATTPIAQNLVSQPSPMIGTNLAHIAQQPASGQPPQQQSFFINGQQIAFSPSPLPSTTQNKPLIPASPTAVQGTNHATGIQPFRFIAASQIGTCPTYTTNCINAGGQYFQVPINMTNANQTNLSSLHAGNLCIRQPIMTSNSIVTASTILPTAIQQPKSVVNTSRIPLTLQQTKTMIDLKRMYNDDVTKLSTHGQLMGAKMNSEKPKDIFEDLCYYHIAQDHDNTPEALAKTDTILEEAITAIMDKKSRTLQAIDELIFCENELYHGLSSHNLDNYLNNKLLLEMEKDSFESEKDLLKRINAKISEAEESNDFKDPTDDRFSDLTRLKLKLESDPLHSESSEEYKTLPKPRANLKRQRFKPSKPYKPSRFLEGYRRFLGPLIDFPLDLDEDIKETDFNLPDVNEILQSWSDNPDSIIKTKRLHHDQNTIKSSNSCKSADSQTNNNSPPISSCNFEDQNSYVWDEMEENSNSQLILNRTESQIDNEDTLGSFSTTNPKSNRNTEDDEMALMRSLEEAANDIEYLDAPATSPSQPNNNNPVCDEVKSVISFSRQDDPEFGDIDESNCGIHSEDPDIDAAVRSILSPST